LIIKPAGESQPGRHRWKDDNMSLKEAEWEGVVDWIHLAQDTAPCSMFIFTVTEFAVWIFKTVLATCDTE